MSQNSTTNNSINQTNGQPKTPATLQDIFDAVNTAREENTIEFVEVKQRLTTIEATMATKSELAAAVVRIDKVEDKIDHIETQMITKPYLDEKLHDLKGDLIVIARKEDRKVDSVVSLLRQKNIFSAQEAAEVLSTAVFPKPTT